MKKTCTNCNTEKDELQFNLRGEGRRHSWCKLCFNKLTKAHYKSNREEYKRKNSINSRNHKKKAREFVDKFKEGKPCRDCNQSFPTFVMDFDHLTNNKLDSIARLVTGGYAIETILEEIQKCELVCSNCHRIRTHNRKLKGR